MWMWLFFLTRKERERKEDVVELAFGLPSIQELGDGGATQSLSNS